MLETLTKLKNSITSSLIFLAMKINKNIQYMYQNDFVEKNMLIYYSNEKYKKALCSYERF